MNLCARIVFGGALTIVYFHECFTRDKMAATTASVVVVVHHVCNMQLFIEHVQHDNNVSDIHSSGRKMS